jgi:prepilin-type N-terminal cleavage/methylation domain-containing protein
MKGFTLIELMTVVMIVAILAAIAIPNYLVSVERTRATEGILLAKQVARAKTTPTARKWETIRIT